MRRNFANSDFCKTAGYYKLWYSKTNADEIRNLITKRE